MTKIIKSFKKFESSFAEKDIIDEDGQSIKVLKTFGPNDFKSYREEIEFWEIDHNRRNFGSIVKEEMWKSYVKPGLEISVVELSDSGLATVLHKGTEIIKAIDENDNEIKLRIDLVESAITESVKHRKIKG